MAAVSVVVPVHDGASSLPTLLAALAAQEGVPAFELVVVDNASTDGTAGVAAASPVVSRVVHEARPGSYAARNAGWRAATGDVLAFTDADCRPDPGWLRELLARLEDGADVVGGAVVPDVSPRAGWAAWWAGYDRAMYLDQEDNVGVHGFAATANMATRRDVLEALGGFDAELRSGGDKLFSRRATAAGYRLGWAPEAVVLHASRAGLRATWTLWRRLGKGWGELAGRGQWPVPLRRDPVLRKSLAVVRERARERGVEVPLPALAGMHAVARAAALRGRLDARRG